MYWENQPEPPSDKGSNWSKDATRDIGSLPLCSILKPRSTPFVEPNRIEHWGQCVLVNANPESLIDYALATM